ncbi:MAG: hypothetical protein JWP97_3498 [Labilithrix sp.]|nr:hypothetical protein [Labilithrix sp.]
MKAWRGLGLVSLLLLAACDGITIGKDGGDTSPPADEAVVDETAVAGANQNDRSASRDGDDLKTGAMVVSPDGRYIVMQRNTVTLVYDVAQRTYHELASPLLRVAFAKSSSIVFAAVTGGTLQAIDLPTLTTRWSIPQAGAVSLLRLGDDDVALLVGDGSQVRVVDGRTGAVRGTTPVSGATTYATFVPGQARALVVEPTAWRDGGPHTVVLDVDLTGINAAGRVDVPNCEAPVAVLPSGARAFLSPTYCSPGAQAVPGETWTNPDPVSVIELAGRTIAFNKNLPGFGPVAMAKDGSRIVAYLDTARMDEKMFTDPKQVPWKDGPRYHLMTIDPATLAFQLTAIGNAIPRFAITNDGRGLLVDASAKFTSRVKLAARASVSVGADGVSGSVETNLDVFGSGSTFGYFDLGAQTFSAFAGPNAPLDRFVQFADGRFVLTLGKRADGLGGIPYLIDLQARTTAAVPGDFGSGVRDVGLAVDGQTPQIRVRLPALVHDGGFYSREGLCTSLQGPCGLSGSLTATYEASVPFAMVPPPPPPYEPPPVTPPDECPGGHDCF